MADLGLDRKRLLANEESVADGSVPLPLRELLDQVGRDLPAVGRLGGRDAHALELAQTSLVRVRGGARRGLKGVDAALGASDLGNLPVDRTDGRLGFGGERHDVAGTHRLGAARVERDVIRAARGRLDDGVEGPLELIGESLARDASRDHPRPPLGIGRQRVAVAHDAVAGGVAGDGGVDLLEDVAACTEFAQRLLPALGESPRRGRDALGEPEPFEVLETGNERGRVDEPRSGSRVDRDLAPLGPPLQLAVERGEPVLGDLLGVGALDVDGKAGPKLLGGQLLRAPPQALRDVRAIEADLAPLAIDAAHDQMRVRVARVVVVDRGPLELAAEVLLDRGHQPPDVVGEVELAGVLGRHDDPELMSLAATRLVQRLDARGPLGRVEPALRSVLLDAVALDVPQVQRRGLGTPCGHPRHVSLDDHTASALPRPRNRHPRARATDLAPGAPGPAARRAEQGVAEGAACAARRRPMVTAHPRRKYREIVKITQGWIPHFIRPFQCLSTSRIQHGYLWIPLLMNRFDPISTARIHLFILPSVFDSGFEKSR